MLRNFAHKYVGPQRTKKGKKNKKDTLFRGELVVNNVNLRASPIAVEETKVSRILGQYDMYQDTAQPTAQQREIEAMLGKLENHVSTIFRKIIKAFEAGDPSVWVTREERNSIRKFLFILKYRGSTFHQRFHHTGSDEYNFNDKSRLKEYMEKNNFKRPVDVWFHGLKTIINLKMDTENWRVELPEKMYQDDAMWFLMHSEMMYLAICTPSDPETEFILTDNSYNVFEGPNTFTKNPVTGKSSEAGWTSFHEFAPLSPKLMIVLRSNMLPVPEEDSSPNIKAWRDAHRKEVVDDYYGQSMQSSLADLPISKARNSYSQVVNGRVQYLPGEDGTPLKSHKFCFSFFPVGIEHVNKINHILFDNAHRCTSIVFGSKDIFFKTLEWYMTCPPTLGKVLVGDSTEARRKLLTNLAALMKSLGSTKEPVWTDEGTLPNFNEIRDLEQSLAKGMAEWMLTAKTELKESPEPPIGPKFAYILLGGSDETFFEDMEQARMMLKRRIKIDVHSKGMPEEVRAQARELLIEEYLTYPPRRVLFFSKRVRFMVLGHDDEGNFTGKIESQAEDPEDIIAQALHDKITAEKLNRLVYKTVMNDIDQTKDPISEHEFWTTPVPSLGGILRLQAIRKIVFGIPGLLKECGVPEIEQLALNQEQRIRQYGISRVKGLPYPFMSDEQKMELLTRVMVKPKFREVLAGSVRAGLLRKLEDVIFKTSYPTPPMTSPI
ncbi:hypothetical protein O1611_g5776 [Lasiodiplodia mahajangana]|uniref:Uncharacterized protein n=1 Tax=Lasiodiplodia mahajangana TaxID=1108764 RepID=A0ACC2JK76_9PEZI|nr:hypothetical protein O1611_g5776 [Lasiodiplodia mahajangana]